MATKKKAKCIVEKFKLPKATLVVAKRRGQKKFTQAGYAHSKAQVRRLVYLYKKRLGCL